MYGLEHNPKRFEQNWLRPKTRIPGLYLTGQDVLSCGVGGAMFAGFIAALSTLSLREKGRLLNAFRTQYRGAAEEAPVPVEQAR
jgi:all-trans-retinol 13,14-reductase